MNSPKKASALAFLSLAVCASLPGAADSAATVPLDRFQLARDDVEVTLWAHTPQLHNPTNMDIDSAGRIWVTEAVNYRRHSQRRPEGDRVVVLEDTDGDGKADSSHTFVQEPQLLAPLGIAVIDNKVIVSCAPDVIVYTDVDRNLRFDPRIDKREVLLNGFDGRNHDHSVHSFTEGWDGKWYFVSGNAGAFFTDRSGHTFRIGSTYDPGNRFGDVVPAWRPQEYAGATSDDGHVYVGGFAARMNPDGTDVEIIGYNFRNSYEIAVTSFGDVFQNDNDDQPASRTAFLLPYGNAGFFSADGQRTWIADQRPGQSIHTAQWRQEDPDTMPAGDVYGAGAPTGIVSYEGDLFGPDWQGLILSCDAARNVVFAYRAVPRGAGFDLQRFDLLTSNPAGRLAGIDSQQTGMSDDLRTSFRPSDVAVGPDGSIFVADWFDPRVGGHNDFDDATVGAIYRIVPKGRRPQVPKLDLDTVAGQLAALGSPAVNVRPLGAHRLIAAGDASYEAVNGLLSLPNEFLAARAIGVLARLGPRGKARVRELLADANPHFRIAALRALRTVQQTKLSDLAALASDASAAVRREVAVALRDVPFASSKNLLLELAALYPGGDRTYLAAWRIACTGKRDEVYRLLAASLDRRFDRTSQRYADLLFTLTPADAIPFFVARAQDTRLAPAARLQALTALGFIDRPAAADAVYEMSRTGTGKIQEHASWWVFTNINSRWASYGLRERLKRDGVYDPEKVSVTTSVVPEPDPARQIPLAVVRNLTGDPARGRDLVTACRMCHSIAGSGAEYGPVLDGWTSRQGIEATLLAIINPSNDIALGFEGSRIELKDGGFVDGIVVNRGDPVLVKSMGGLLQMVPKSQVLKIERLRRSLMLGADQLGLAPQHVADIAAYLKTLNSDPN